MAVDNKHRGNNNAMPHFENLFTYFKSDGISRTEKILLLAGAVVYVISPVDLIPLNPLDDIGVIGAVMAYINWRVKHIKTLPQKTPESAADAVITTEVIDNTNFFNNKKR